MTGLAALLKRAQVLAGSALTYLTAISAVLVVLAQQLDSLGVLGVDIPEWVTRVLASVIVVLGAVILQVRRVTPVADNDKGLLPPKGPAAEALSFARRMSTMSCPCHHLDEYHHATCLPPFEAQGQQCHHREDSQPCPGDHCEWMHCPCPGPILRGVKPSP